MLRVHHTLASGLWKAYFLYSLIYLFWFTPIFQKCDKLHKKNCVQVAIKPDYLLRSYYMTMMHVAQSKVVANNIEDGKLQIIIGI